MKPCIQQVHPVDAVEGILADAQQLQLLLIALLAAVVGDILLPLLLKPGLGKNPRITDSELNQLSVAILPLPGGEFYHYGTSRELISSTLAVQNLVRDQRAIMQRKVKPHPAMFVQNAVLHQKLTAENSELWIENSYIGENWKNTFLTIICSKFCSFSMAVKSIVLYRLSSIL